MTKQGNLFPRGGGGHSRVCIHFCILSLLKLVPSFALNMSPRFKIDFKYTNSSSPALLQLPHKSTGELVWRLVPLRPPPPPLGQP